MKGKEIVSYIHDYGLENFDFMLYDLNLKHMIGYNTITELAKKWHIPSGTIAVWLFRGKLKNAVNLKASTFIPEETERPE